MKTNEYFYGNKYELFDFMILLMLGMLISSGLTTVEYITSGNSTQHFPNIISIHLGSTMDQTFYTISNG